MDLLVSPAQFWHELWMDIAPEASSGVFLCMRQAFEGRYRAVVTEISEAGRTFSELEVAVTLMAGYATCFNPPEESTQGLGVTPFGGCGETFHVFSEGC